MSIEEMVSREKNALMDEAKSIKEAELQKLIIIGEDYVSLKRTPGWIRLSNELLERTKSLSSRLLTADNEKIMFRVQGELLGVQSVLNIVDVTIEDMEEAKRQLKGEGNE